MQKRFVFLVLLFLVGGGMLWGINRQTSLHAQSGNVYLYLPLLTKPGVSVSPTPTQPPTSTPTSTPTPPPNNLPAIVNGDFELGSTVNTRPLAAEASLGWQELRSLSNRPLIVQTAPGLPVTPHSGSWFAWLGGDHNLGETPNHRSHLIHWDHFFLPDRQPAYLHLYYQIISEEQPNEFGICDRDVINLWVNNSLVYQGQVCQQTNTTGWTKGVVDLSPFAGQWITLEFEMRTDFEKMSHFFLDDVSFQPTP